MKNYVNKVVPGLAELVRGELAVDLKLISFGNFVDVLRDIDDDVVGGVFQVVPHEFCLNCK
jgi:hypothetical protein